MKIVLWIALTCAGASAIGQTRRQPATQTAPAEGKAAVIRVTGTYLAPPRSASPGATPILVVTCSRGTVEKNSLDFKAVLAARQGSFPAMMEARFDGKPTYIGAETISPDRTSVSFPGSDLQKILHAHRVVIGADEYLGAEILIQFEMPDSASIQSACGKGQPPAMLPFLIPDVPAKPVLSTEWRQNQAALK